jgi:hypothetical protein
MKTFIIIPLILCLFTFSEINAQSSDTLQNVRFMKSRSKQFIATIKIDQKIIKGLLYDSDTSGITILDTLFMKVFYPVSTIKTLEIRRANASWHGAKVAFLGTEGVGVGLGTVILMLGAFTADGVAYIAPYALIPVVFAAPLAIGGAIIVAIINSSTPGVSILNFNKDSFKKKFDLISKRTQKHLIKKFPYSPRMIVQ